MKAKKSKSTLLQEHSVTRGRWDSALPDPGHPDKIVIQLCPERVLRPCMASVGLRMFSTGITMSFNWLIWTTGSYIFMPVEASWGLGTPSKWDRSNTPVILKCLAHHDPWILLSAGSGNGTCRYRGMIVPLDERSNHVQRWPKRDITSGSLGQVMLFSPTQTVTLCPCFASLGI